MVGRMAGMLALVVLMCPVARGEQYWVAYEGNDFPENEGWGRVTNQGGAQRTIEDGVLVLDGLADVRINDLYGLGRQPFDPGPGELFHAEWRLGVDQVIGVRDPAFAVFSEESWAVGLTWSQTFIRSGFELVDIPFQTSGMHTYVLTSSDMRSYEFFADGVLLHQGEFVQDLGAPHVRWGDSVEGAASLSRWDYVRFGVVPEPRTSFMMCAGLVLSGVLAKRR